MRARLWLYKGDADRAMVNLEQAIRRDPDQPRFYVTRSLAHLKKERLDLAIADCDRAIELDPQAGAPTSSGRRPGSARRRGAVPDRPGAGAAARPDLIPRAGQCFRARRWELPTMVEENRGRTVPRRLRRSPVRAVNLVARGNAHLAKQEYDEAVRDFTEAVRLDPAHAPAYAARAEAWARKHYRERELDDITEAVRLEPRNTSLPGRPGTSHTQPRPARGGDGRFQRGTRDGARKPRALGRPRQ